MKSHPQSSQSGQALFEFLVSMVALLVLFSALIQIGWLGRARTQTMINARREAGRWALSPIDAGATPAYIRDWHAGDDERRYSVDDYSDTASAGAFRDTIVAHSVADASEWAVYDRIPDNRVVDLRSAAVPVREFGLVVGRDGATVPLLPAISHLLYNRDSIRIESEAWMTATHGIY